MLYLRILARLFPSFFFFFNDTATTEIYTLSLHDALPILTRSACSHSRRATRSGRPARRPGGWPHTRSEEHTSELQSQSNLVCRLLLEKKKQYNCQLLSLLVLPRNVVLESDTHLSLHPLYT